MRSSINTKKVISLVKEVSSLVNQKELSQQIHLKGKNDFVTGVDLQISQTLKEKLKEMYPPIHFFSEEEKGELKDPCWILDPIDGTTNFIYGMKQSSISLALYEKGCITFGVVYNPFRKECYYAIKGKGSFLGKRRLHVSNRELKESIIEFGAGSSHKESADLTFETVKDVFLHCLDIRRICSCALTLCYLADGCIDGYFQANLKPWDIAAGSLILEEAGGKITDYNGIKADFKGPSTIIATNQTIHDPLQKLIKKHYENS